MIVMEMVSETIYWVSKATNVRLKLATVLRIDSDVLIEMEMVYQMMVMPVLNLGETAQEIYSDVLILIWMDGAT